MSAHDDLLERNVARLLGRAYRPVAPSEEFRRELLRRIEAAASDRARATRRERAAIVECAERELAGGPFAPRRFGFGVIAVAALVLVLFAVWRFVAPAPARPEREGLAAILARGAVARSDGEGWRALEPRDGVAHERLTERATFLTPATATLELAFERGGTLTLLASSELDVAPAAVPGAAPEAALSAALARGSLLAAHDASVPPWRLEFACDTTRRRAAVELSAGSLRLAAPGSGVSACARLELSADGRAELVLDTWRAPLVAGVERELCADVWISAPSAEPGRTRVASELPERAEPAVEPASVPDVSGEVVDAATGEPLDEFTVVLAPLLTIPRPREPRFEPFTAARGRFAIDDVRKGDYVVWVGARGRAYFASSVVELGDEPSEVRAELGVGATLTGRVLDRATGRPIVGASVISESDVPASMIELHLDVEYESWIAIERTDGAGRFVLEHLRSAAPRLRVTAPGFAPAWLACDGSAGDVELSLTPSATLVGRVESADGTPQSDHVLVAVPMDSSQYPLYWSEQIVTDDRGEFRCVDLPAIQCVVVHLGSLADRASWSPVPAVRYVTLAAGEERRADFTTPLRGARVFGRLLDPSGAPVGNRTLTLVPAGDIVEDPTRWRITNVEADGRYDVRGLSAGTYELYVSARAPMEVLYQLSIVVEKNRELELDVHLGGGAILGRAVAQDGGAPVAGVVWILMRTVDGEEDFAARVIGDGDGKFEIPSLVDGEYRLIALPQDGVHALASRAGLVVSGGAAVGPVELALGRGSRASVLVLDAAGAPVVGALVELRDEHGTELVLTELQRTDTQGRLELVGVPGGRFAFVAKLGDVASAEVTRDIIAGEAAAIELRLAR
ncbi:MAG: carboxypeptidase regulatory-like domain-containing protein [Planctomycetes bacterium]|nr:carboxypeptidase regulatory-like domain-containing protein [Planctomycetota bacterium]